MSIISAYTVYCDMCATELPPQPTKAAAHTATHHQGWERLLIKNRTTHFCPPCANKWYAHGYTHLLDTAIKKGGTK